MSMNKLALPLTVPLRGQVQKSLGAQVQVTGSSVVSGQEASGFSPPLPSPPDLISSCR